jgi:hypothetical protein
MPIDVMIIDTPPLYDVTLWLRGTVLLPMPLLQLPMLLQSFMKVVVA